MCRRVSRFDFGKADVEKLMYNSLPLIGRIFFEETVSTSAFRSFMMLFTSALDFMFQNTS
jgi:hypothetical protein